MSRIGRSGFIETFDREIRPDGCPDFSDAPLDTGIRQASNIDLEESDEVVDGEVIAHTGNPGSDRCFGQPIGDRGDGKRR
jgi:hypothetical protein